MIFLKKLLSTSMEFPLKTKNTITTWSINPTPRIYQEKMRSLIWKYACPPVLIAALFTVVKTWKQVKRTLADEWIKMEYYSVIKKNGIAICRNISGGRDCRTKWSKPDRERQIPYDVTYMWNLKKKMIQMNSFTK